MLLFQKRFQPGLVDGSITLTFRQWDKPRVRRGGRYRCHPIGVIEVDDISRVSVSSITEDDARRAGFTSLSELMAYMKGMNPGLVPGDEVFRVEIHYGGDGDRVPEALDSDLTEEQFLEIRDRLRRMDARSESPWTSAVLQLIERSPRTAASRLAEKMKRETASFKADVVKLKQLGLTQSFEVGYEISPRGRAFLARVKASRKGKT